MDPHLRKHINSDMKETVLRISDLSTYFYVSGGIVKAVDGIDLTIRENEIVTVVGES